MSLSLNNPRFEVVAGRTEILSWDAKLVDAADGKTQVAMANDDHVRFKLAATAGGVPVLDLVSSAPTANGSAVGIVSRGSASALATGTVTLAQVDTASLSGLRYFELLHIDVSESSNPDKRNKIICRGQINFLDEQGGTLGP